MVDSSRVAETATANGGANPYDIRMDMNSETGWGSSLRAQFLRQCLGPCDQRPGLCARRGELPEVNHHPAVIHRRSCVNARSARQRGRRWGV
jgi:hypothetical protein